MLTPWRSWLYACPLEIQGECCTKFHIKISKMRIFQFFSFIAVLSDVIPKGYITGFERKLVLSFLWLHGFFSLQWYAFGADHSGWVRFRIDLAEWFLKMCYWKVVAEPWKDTGILGLWRKRIQSGASDEAWLLRAFCNKVLLKHKRYRESFWHRYWKGAERVPPSSL